MVSMEESYYDHSEINDLSKVMRQAVGWVLAGIFCCSISGCVSYDELRNYQGDLPEPEGLEIPNPPAIRIQANDVLSIKVHSSDMETSAPFNLTPVEQLNLSDGHSSLLDIAERAGCSFELIYRACRLLEEKKLLKPLAGPDRD